MQKIFLTFEFFNTVVQKISFGVQKKTIDLEFVVAVILVLFAMFFLFL